MPNYYALLTRKINETGSDPAKLRQVVYEAARLALKRQVNILPLAVSESRRQINELEEAITRLEAEAMNGRLFQEDSDDVSDGSGGQFEALSNQEVHEDANTNSDWHLDTRDRPDAPPPITPGVAAQRQFSVTASLKPEVMTSHIGNVDIADRAFGLSDSTLCGIDASEPPPQSVSRALVLVTDHSPPTRSSSGYPTADNFRFPHVTVRASQGSSPPISRTPLLSGFAVAFQLAVAAIAAAALYIVLWGHNPASMPGADTTALTSPVAAAASGSSPAAAPRDATQVRGPAGEATTAAAQGPREPFPRPTSYGIYAIRGDRLIELEPVATAPVDPRTRGVLQIVKPSLTLIDGAKLSFIAFRRDFVSSVPERVTARIAARIAKSMNFDSTGKAVVTTPATDTWLIRDQGYDLRVSPMRESQEMVMMRPENADFSFPPGRYELMLGGQPYDFVIAGAVTDSAHCVEGVATVRGPAFYECRQP